MSNLDSSDHRTLFHFETVHFKWALAHRTRRHFWTMFTYGFLFAWWSCSAKFLNLNHCYVLYVLLWIKYWLMWFESLLVFILFKFKKCPNISGIRVVHVGNTVVCTDSVELHYLGLDSCGNCTLLAYTSIIFTMLGWEAHIIWSLTCK